MTHEISIQVATPPPIEIHPLPAGTTLLSGAAFVGDLTAAVEALEAEQDTQDAAIAAARVIAEAAAIIDDASTTTAAWSAGRIITEIVARLDAVVDLAPGVLDTLGELAAALNDDPDFAANVLAALAALNTEQDAQDAAITAAQTAATAAQTTADGKVSKSGDTMTGDLTLTGSSRRVRIKPGTGGFSPGYEMYDANGVLRAMSYYATSFDEWRMWTYDAAGAQIGSLSISGTTGDVVSTKPIATGKPTAAGQVPQLNTYDPVTGRRLVDGREEGHTGWREMVGAMAWGSLINTATTSFQIKRERGLAMYRGTVNRNDGASTTIANILDGTQTMASALPNGFRPSYSSTYPVIEVPLAYRGSTGASSTWHFTAASSAWYWPAGVGALRFMFVLPTEDPWPTSLPGTKATDPYSLPV